MKCRLYFILIFGIIQCTVFAQDNNLKVALIDKMIKAIDDHNQMSLRCTEVKEVKMVLPWEVLC